MNQQEYWEDQSNKILFKDGKTYYDHPFRKRMILKYLLDYDFENKKVLEIGCGVASTALCLWNIYGSDLFHYEGIDLVERFCDFSRNRFGLSCHQGDMCDIKFSARTFDCIFIFDVLEHISENDREMGYEEIGRVLKDNAIVFINNPLSVSHHDPEFDHPFSILDIGNLCKILNGNIVRIDCYGYQDYLYQFIVIERHK